VAGMLSTRPVIFAAGLALAFGLAGRPAPAELDMVIGARNVVKNEPLSSCNTKARQALIAVVGKAGEYGDTGSWLGSGEADTSGNSFASAAIHCYPLDEVNGYVVTFTCAAQTPPSTETASVICDQLATAFGKNP
jgi:hypothetical protein